MYYYADNTTLFVDAKPIKLEFITQQNGQAGIMPFDLGTLKLLARGGQADIYEIDSTRILRVLRNPDPQDGQYLMAERTIMAMLREQGVGVPAVYEYCEVNGLPAFEMERISGSSMMEQLLQNPLAMGSIAHELARLHSGFLRMPAIDGLIDIKKRVDLLIGFSTWIDDDDRAFVRSLLSSLPDGDNLLHGDFHPGNILTSGGSSYIIDWFGASKGHFLSDIAHTYLLLADKPRIPSEGIVKHELVKMMAKRFGGMYLKEIRARIGFDMGELSKWMVVRAAERTNYGQPSELASKAKFVKACRLMSEKGIDPALWYKQL
jgi:aminoglycoside phosphotransferase (APT) family kinase protein